MTVLTAFLVSALGFTAKKNALTGRSTLTNTKQQLLTLRGGAISTDALITTAATISTAAGFSTWVAPKTNLAKYGAKNAPTDKEIFLLRSTAALQIALGVALIAGKADFNKAALVFLFGHALQCLAMMPTSEMMGGPTTALGGCAVLFAALGELTRLGVLPPGVLTNVAIFFYVVISAQEVLLPKPTIEGFGFGEPSPLFTFFFKTYATVKLQLGAFVLVSKLTGQVGFGLAAAMAIGITGTIRAILSAEETGFDKAPLLFWTVVYAALGLLAYTSASA